MIRFVTEFANEQLFYGVRNAVPFFLLELVSMVCISSCIASLCMNLNKGHRIASVSCALGRALASYTSLHDFPSLAHAAFSPCMCGNTDNGKAFLILCNSTNFSVFAHQIPWVVDELERRKVEILCIDYIHLDCI